MTVLDNTPRDQYTATSGQTVFPYTFEISASGDIVVLQNGFPLNEGGQYAVSGVGSDSGGNITLVSGAAAGDVITLYRDMALDRLTSYTNGGDFLAADVNNDFDRLWLALQQNTGTSNRALVAPNSDPLDINMTIPDKDARRSKFLKFNSVTGNPEASNFPPGDFAASGMNVYDFTGDGVAVNFTLGMEPGGENNTQVYIDGVYQQKNTYSLSGSIVQFLVAPLNLSKIEVVVIEALSVGFTTAPQVSFTQAGATYGRNVQLKLQESVSVKDFGAVGNGATDDTAAIQAAIDSGARWINIPIGVYLTSVPIVINSSVTLQGEEFNRSIIKKTTTTGGTGSNTMRGGAYVDSWTGDDVIQIRHLDNQYTGNVSIKDLSIQRTSYASGSTGIFAARTRKCNYENVLIVGFQYGYKTYDTFLSTFHRLEVLGCEFGISHLDDGSGIGSGTSCSFESCYVNCDSGTVNPSRGYNIFGLSYSTFTSCAIDNSNRTDGTAPDAYYMQACRGVVLNGCGCENSTANVIHTVGGSNLVINGFRAAGISGVSLGTSAYVYLDGGNITMTASDFGVLSSPGTTLNWIIQSTTDLTEINQRTEPSGGGTFISYGGNSKRFVISEGVAGTRTEKGTFTPTVTPSTSGTITLTAAGDTLYYERIGDIVHLQGWLQVSSVSSPVGGHLNVGALPYTPANLTDNAGRGAANIVWQVGATVTPVAGIILEASTTFRVYVDASTVVTGDVAYIQASYVTSD